MKKFLLIALSYFITSQSFGQNIELSFGAHTGLMRFSGASSTSTSAINEGLNSNSTNNPYGSKNGTGFGIYIQGQYITKKQFIAGLQIGTDALRSKVDITTINKAVFPAPVPATGSTSIYSHYINANPYVGVRLPLAKINVDVTAGLEVAYVVDSNDQGSAKDNNGTKFKTDTDVKTIDVDTRVKFGLAAHYGRLGLTANYAHGFNNYATAIGSANNSAHSEIIRLGINCIVF